MSRGRVARHARPRASRHAPTAAKVPAITALFWVVKVLTTGMGEAAADYLAGVSFVLAGVLGFAGFAVAMWIQVRARCYRAWPYWFAVAMVAVFGTMAADALHIVMSIPYAVTTFGYAAALVVVFAVWWHTEHTLSIHSITTPRRELFYWLTVLVTFALGTAAGDFAAVTLHLGYLSAGVLFAAAMVIPLVGWRFLRLSPVVAFWFAYVLTRPLGASFADWFGKPRGIGNGLGYGDGTVAAVSAVVILAFVAYLARSRHGVQRPERPQRPGAHAEPW
ncbi:MAG: hypothetical protein FWF28_08265 [Micrococcales bacterium]|nr:hypothetical protein [Micrococcales bacterium]